MPVTVLSRDEKDLTQFSFVLGELAAGRSNATGMVSLAAGATLTVVQAINCAPGSRVFLSPASANAAAAYPTTYVLPGNVGKSQFVITHANAGTTDRTFYWLACG